MVYLVTWDLNREKPNYQQARTAFVEHLSTFQQYRDPGLDSVWFVATTWSAQQVSDYLRQKLNDNDRLIVTQIVTGQHQGWLAPAAWEWINARK